MAFGVEQMTALQDKGILLAVHIYNEMVLDWIRRFKKLDTFREAKGLELKIDPRISGLIGDAMAAAYLQGAYRAQQEIAYQLEKGKIMRFAEGRVVTFADLVGDFDFAHSTYQEAIEWFKSKGIVPSGKFKEMLSTLKATSFSISGIEQKRLLRAVKDSIDDAMGEGMTYRQWAKNADQVFSRFGVTPLEPHHLETIFRTNTQSAYSIARYETTITDDNVAGYEFVAVMDNRTRPEHAAMNGFVAAKDDPVWNTWWPPLDYNCRCTTVMVTAYYMERHGMKFNDSVPAGAKVGEDFNQKAFTLDSYYATIREKLKVA